MLPIYSLIFETTTGSPGLSEDFKYRGPGARDVMAAANISLASEPPSQREIEARQRRDRGGRKPSDLMVETFVSPGDESWGEEGGARSRRWVGLAG